jgi:ABC-type Fe3+ transport system substrate-binding protein
MPNRTKSLLAVGALAAAVLSGCGGESSDDAGSGGGGSSAVPSSGTLDDLYEQAKEEGTIVIWTGADPEEMQQAFDQFSEKDPGLKLELTSSNPDEQATKLVTAQAAGQGLPDNFQGRREFMPTIVDAGLVDDDPGWAGYDVPDDIISADGGLVEYKSLYGLAYNTDEISDPSSLPATWDDLADSEWEGRLSVDPRGFPFNILAVQKGEDETVDYVNTLVDQTQPAIIQGSTAGLEKLAAGAQALRPAALEDVKTQQASGAPVEFQALEPNLVQDTLWYLTSEPEHKAAAMLFAIWFTSADGGQVLTAELDNRTNQLPSEATGEVVSYDTPEKAATVASVTPKIAEVLGGS